MKVAVLGASPNPERYSNKAVRLLVEHKHEVFPVNPKYTWVEGLACFFDIDKLPRDIHTLSIYVNPASLSQHVPAIIRLQPERVIFNPGAENPVVEQSLKAAGLDCWQACTLVLLRTKQF